MDDSFFAPCYWVFFSPAKVFFNSHESSWRKSFVEFIQSIIFPAKKLVASIRFKESFQHVSSNSIEKKLQQKYILKVVIQLSIQNLDGKPTT